MYCEFHKCRICKKIRARTVVISWAWIREEMVRDSHVQTEWKIWVRVSKDMMLNFSDSRHPIFRGSSALKSKGKGKLSIRFCGDHDTAEVVLRTIISVNQLSVYGAVAGMCEELAWRISGCSESTGKLVAQNNSEIMVMPTELSSTNKTPRTDETVQRNLLHDNDRKSSRSSSIVQTVLHCRYREDCGEGTVFHDLRRCGT